MIAEDVSIARAATQLTCTSDSLPEIRDEQELGTFFHDGDFADLYPMEMIA